MAQEIYQVKLMTDESEIDFNNSICLGYAPDEIDYKVRAYQAPFKGDHILEVINRSGEIYYLHCKKGSSLKNQLDYMISNVGIILINANGNLYKFDLDAKVNLPIDAFREISFDNAQAGDYCFPYISSLSSHELEVMAVVDDYGISLLNHDAVIWRREEGWAYTGDVKLMAIMKDCLIIESDDPRYNNPQILRLNLKTGELLEQHDTKGRQSKIEVLPLAPHKYSLSMYGFAVLILIAMIYSLCLFPTYFKPAKIYHAASIAYENHKFDDAIELLTTAQSYSPTSKSIKLLLAKSYFSKGGDINAGLALSILSGVSLDKLEYRELKLVMPAQYQKLFISNRKGG